MDAEQWYKVGVRPTLSTFMNTPGVTHSTAYCQHFKNRLREAIEQADSVKAQLEQLKAAANLMYMNLNNNKGVPKEEMRRIRNLEASMDGLNATVREVREQVRRACGT